MVDSCFIIGGLFLLVDRLVAAGAPDSIYGSDDAKQEKKKSRVGRLKFRPFRKVKFKNLQLKKSVVWLKELDMKQVEQSWINRIQDKKLSIKMQVS